MKLIVIRKSSKVQVKPDHDYFVDMNGAVYEAEFSKDGDFDLMLRDNLEAKVLEK